jgi:hypothetical protein
MSVRLLYISLCFAVMAAFVWTLPSQGVPKTSLKFSHQYHLKEVGADCAACHGAAKESAQASDRLLPKMEACAECHDVEDQEKCGTCHVDVDNLEPLDLPAPTAPFSHKAHIEMKGVTCETCHKGLDKVGLSTPKSMPGMAECSACHNGTQAPMTCSVCHAAGVNLRPKSHGADWLHEHRQHVRAGDISCAQCHATSECQECHEGANLVETKASKPGAYAPFSPLGEARQGMTLKRVHTLNSRHTHALDAKGKERQCATCHETATFCGMCHRPEGDLTRFRPDWHGGPDWGAIAGAVGTGGGRHATLARRDIERCAACHDVQGEDPTCLLCHTDRRRGKGNDLKTHGSGFASKVGEGDFHDDDGAICYTCHTYKGPSGGDGFCGYCHGRK